MVSKFHPASPIDAMPVQIRLPLSVVCTKAPKKSTGGRSKIQPRRSQFKEPGQAIAERKEVRTPVWQPAKHLPAMPTVMPVPNATERAHHRSVVMILDMLLIPTEGRIIETESRSNLTSLSPGGLVMVMA